MLTPLCCRPMHLRGSKPRRHQRICISQEGRPKSIQPSAEAEARETSDTMIRPCYVSWILFHCIRNPPVPHSQQPHIVLGLALILKGDFGYLCVTKRDFYGHGGSWRCHICAWQLSAHAGHGCRSYHFKCFTACHVLKKYSNFPNQGRGMVVIQVGGMVVEPRTNLPPPTTRPTLTYLEHE